MNGPTTDENFIGGSGNCRQTIFWPDAEEPQPAIAVRTYAECDIIELRQGDAIVNINAGTVDALCKTLKAYARLTTEGAK
jgi:hypothetical protein